MTLQKIRRGVVGNVLNGISPSNFIPTSDFCLKDFVKMVRPLLAAVSITGLSRYKIEG